MARVKMLAWISGGRHDGREWPPAGETIEVPDWEATDLIRAGVALPGATQAAPSPPPEPAEPEPASVPEPVPELDPGQLVSPADTAAGASAPPAGDQEETGQTAEGATEPAIPEAEPSEAADETPAVAPAPSAPKQAWIEYAVSRGADEDTARSMTKADLMSRYGGRL